LEQIDSSRQLARLRRRRRAQRTRPMRARVELGQRWATRAQTARSIRACRRGLSRGLRERIRTRRRRPVGAAAACGPPTCPPVGRVPLAGELGMGRIPSMQPSWRQR
jgi:hypothetical protein